jgi:predicted glycoside hydrolase/deacetylase ChbG (UPF0249 family)
VKRGDGGPLLIVNADDFGLTTGVCDGILRAHEEGIVTSTSALVVAPAFGARSSALRDSGIGVGAHLCLVGEDPPLLSAGEVPTLVDERGRLPSTWRQVVGRAARGRIDVADMAREWRAQLDAVTGAGLQPTHLDTHQNLHLWPAVGKLLLTLAAERGVGAIRLPRTARWLGPATGVRVLGAVLARKASAASVDVTDTAIGLDQAGHWDERSLVSALSTLSRQGVRSAEVATHPGVDPDPDRDRYRWGYGWGVELAALCSPALRLAVETGGFHLGTYADLRSASRRPT